MVQREILEEVQIFGRKSVCKKSLYGTFAPVTKGDDSFRIHIGGVEAVKTLRLAGHAMIYNFTSADEEQELFRV